KERMLIRLTLDTYKEWYVIDSIEEDGDDSERFVVKAFSLGYELKGKRIPLLQEEAINAEEFLTKVLEPTVWTIGEIDPIFNAMFRSFDISSSNVLDCIEQAREAYGALVVWDTENRKVSFVDIKKHGRFKGMTVNYGKFLQSIKRTRTTDELVTRLYIYGNEDLSIHSVNPTGQGYIEDFSFFMYPFERDAVTKRTIKSSHFMSDELCHAILNHQEAVKQNSPQIESLQNDLALENSNLMNLEIQLDALKLEYEGILQLLDIALATEDTALIEQRKMERDAKKVE